MLIVFTVGKAAECMANLRAFVDRRQNNQKLAELFNRYEEIFASELEETLTNRIQKENVRKKGNSH